MTERDKQTKELAVVYHSWSDVGIYEGGNRIALMKLTDIDEESCDRLEVEQKEKARRIVAAYNATLCVPVESLESGVIGELVEVLSELITDWHNGDMASFNFRNAEKVLSNVRGQSPADGKGVE